MTTLLEKAQNLMIFGQYQIHLAVIHNYISSKIL